MESALVPCLACGGLVHPIAGRCKHCRADLIALREVRVAPREPPPPPLEVPRMPRRRRWPMYFVAALALAAGISVGVAVEHLVAPSRARPTVGESSAT